MADRSLSITRALAHLPPPRRRAPGTALLVVLAVCAVGVLNPLACLLHCAALHQSHAQAHRGATSIGFTCHVAPAAHGHHDAHRPDAAHGHHDVHRPDAAHPPQAEGRSARLLGCMRQRGAESTIPQAFYDVIPAAAPSAATPPLLGRSSPIVAPPPRTWAAPPPAPPPRKLA